MQSASLLRLHPPLAGRSDRHVACKPYTRQPFSTHDVSTSGDSSRGLGARACAGRPCEPSRALPSPPEPSREPSRPPPNPPEPLSSRALLYLRRELTKTGFGRLREGLGEGSGRVRERDSEAVWEREGSEGSGKQTSRLGSWSCRYALRRMYAGTGTAAGSPGPAPAPAPAPAPGMVRAVG